jgi:hypothetical protein
MQSSGPQTQSSCFTAASYRTERAMQECPLYESRPWASVLLRAISNLEGRLADCAFNWDELVL